MKARFFYLFSIVLFSFPLEAQVSLEIVGEVRRLTPDEQYFMRPSWSPDGNTLAFTSRNYHGIWLLDLQSGAITQAVEKPGAGFEFTWSPDGRYIAYRARVKQNKRSFHTIELYEIQSGETQLVQEPVRVLGTPKWGPNNSSIVFTEDQELRILSTQLETSPSFKKPAGSNRFIAYTSRQELQVASVSDSLHEKLTFKDYQILNPAISPDASRVVYEILSGEIIVQDLGNGKRVSIGEGHRPSWSPDGAWICYMVTVDDGHEYLSSEIVISSADGEESIELTKTKDMLEMNPSWSPDGESIAYDEHRAGTIMISRVRLE